MAKNNNLQKFLTISFFVLSFMFVLLLMLFMFNNTIGKNFAEEVQANSVVRIIVIAMSVLYFINAISLFIAVFFTKETLSSISVITKSKSVTKVTRSSIAGIVKHNAQFVDGVKVRGVNMSQDVNGGVHLSVAISVIYVPVDQVVGPFRFILFNAFNELLGLEFASIDFAVTAFKPKYTPDLEAIEQQTIALKAKKEKLKAKALEVEKEEELSIQAEAEQAELQRKKEIEEAINKAVDEINENKETATNTEDSVTETIEEVAETEVVGEEVAEIESVEVTEEESVEIKEEQPEDAESVQNEKPRKKNKNK